MSVLVVEDERKIRELLRCGLLFGLGLLLPLVVFALLAEDVWTREALFVTVATAGAGALIIPAKLLFERARPALEHLPVGAPRYAFPSGHAAGSMAFGAAVIMLAWRTPWRWGVLILASLAILLVGLSRVYLGVHHASDVLAGWCVGVSWAVSMHLVVFGVRTDRSTTSRRSGGPD